MEFDSDSEGTVVSIILVLLALSFSIMIFDYLGMFAMMSHFAEGIDENPTLDDYQAIDDIEYEDDVVAIYTPENPTLYGINEEREVTHIEVSRPDGKMYENREMRTGVQKYTYTPPEDTNGDYTVNVIHHRPAQPGFLGKPEINKEQQIKFTIEDGELTVTEVAQEANFN